MPAAAFDAETVENAEFIVRKPEGFPRLHDDKACVRSSQRVRKGCEKTFDGQRRDARHAGTNVDELRVETERQWEVNGSSRLRDAAKAAWRSNGYHHGGEVEISAVVLRKQVGRRGTVLPDFGRPRRNDRAELESFVTRTSRQGGKSLFDSCMKIKSCLLLAGVMASAAGVRHNVSGAIHGETS